MTERTRRLLDLLRIRTPIIQAPMAGVSSPAMAAAVSTAGALGSVGLGAGDPAQARAMIEAIRTRTDAPFNVNLFCHRPAVPRPDIEQAWIARLAPEFAAYGVSPPQALSEIYRSFLVDDAMLALLVELRPPVVSFHFGLPGDQAIRALREMGCVLLATATSLDEAKRIEAAGIDGIVAQGWEAGGHRGSFDPDAPDDMLGTFALTRLLAQRTNLPVIAAGGIMDGAGIAAALKLGAAAAQLGTAFVGSDESLADEGYRAALFAEPAHHTVMTRAVSGRPARSLASRFTALGATVAAEHIPDYPIAYDLGKALHGAAKATGEHSFGAHWAGQGAPLARALPAARLVEALVAELAEALG